MSYPRYWLINPGANFVIVSLLLIPVGLYFGLAFRTVSLGIEGDLQKLKSRFAVYTVEYITRTSPHRTAFFRRGGRPANGLEVWSYAV